MEIEEDIGHEELKLNPRAQRLVDKASEVDPAETFTSDFYQVPVAGGVPIRLTIDNSRRPFTPPFVQLSRKPLQSQLQRDQHQQAQAYIDSQHKRPLPLAEECEEQIDDEIDDLLNDRRGQTETVVAGQAGTKQCL